MLADALRNVTMVGIYALVALAAVVVVIAFALVVLPPVQRGFGALRGVRARRDRR